MQIKPFQDTCSKSIEKLFQLSDIHLNRKIQISPGDNIELLIGAMILNRIVGIAYQNLDLTSLNESARHVLQTLSNDSEEKALNFKNNLYYLSGILKDIDFKYALLKGSFLSMVLYTSGQRTSNDIDILVDSKDVTKLQDILIQNGFIQGHYNVKNNTIIQATRIKVIQSKMNFGETVPFIKFINGKLLEVDINFSVDFKPDNNRNLVTELLRDTISVPIQDHEFCTLNILDFFIQLCCHLYKEATTYPWVLTRRDLMLYKFSGVNVFLHHYGSETYFEALTCRIQQYHVERECYYTFENSSIIYPNLNKIDGFIKAKNAIQPENMCFMTQVFHPSEKKLFIHHMHFIDWFCCSNRVAQLEEL